MTGLFRRFAYKLSTIDFPLVVLLSFSFILSVFVFLVIFVYKIL